MKLASTGRITKKTERITLLLILSIIILILLDAATTFYAFGYSGSCPEEIGPLAGPESSLKIGNLIGSTVFCLILILFLLTFKLWQYKIIRFILWIWLIRGVITVIMNSYAIYILLSPSPF